VDFAIGALLSVVFVVFYFGTLFFIARSKKYKKIGILFFVS